MSDHTRPSPTETLLNVYIEPLQTNTLPKKLSPRKKKSRVQFHVNKKKGKNQASFGSRQARKKKEAGGGGDRLEQHVTRPR